ncbi:MAG: polysaccharide biosynthesis protein [Bacillota bacterium]
MILLASDALLVNAGVFFALLIRFEGNPPHRYLQEYGKVAVAFTLMTLVVFLLAGLYSSLWRYASVDDVFTILRGTMLSTLALFLLIYALPALAHEAGWSSAGFVKSFPRSVIILTFLLNTILVGGLRFSIRYARRTAWASRSRFPWSSTGDRGAGARRGHRTLIVGAGDAGALVARELAKHQELGYEPLGFVDDDPYKQRMKVHGLPVLGTRQDLPRLVRDLDVAELIIAMPSAAGRVVREVVASVRDLHVKVKTLPGMYELLDGTVSISQIREVQIEDLLGREPVAVNLEEIAGYLSGERVLVTGAGGSIGSELCRQVASFRPRQLILLDHGENGVFETSLHLRHSFPDLEATVVIADVRDRDKILQVFEHYRPEVVFHAAAHKHVPLMEAQPDEAIKTNVFGSKNVADAAFQVRAKRFVMISTDKAVNPSSVMGATKRVAEMVVQALDGERRRLDPSGTRFVAVRFGNVLGSRGSVVPVFKEQIARGGPVTVTHPDMRRYFMTIPEAVQLVIQAGAMGEGGEIFILDMGEPVRILDLAENLIRLSGLEPGVDIPIVFTGPRRGEKLYEELMTADEDTVSTRHKRIYIGAAHSVERAWLEGQLAVLAEVISLGAPAPHTIAKLQEVIPTYVPPAWEETAASLDAPGMPVTHHSRTD